ncbi:MAG: NADH-quinone oxidoreductase subunit A [Actinobacteria bacterium]|nr:NADH-quinone oxidoreductase subunit A [Actinomycetota bacterium]
MVALAAFGAAFTLLVATAALVLLGRWLAGPPGWAATAPERVPFAGGLPPDVHAWNRFHARYYVMALLFLTFDMEMVYMFPWAVVFRQEGAVAIGEIFVFISILALGILYAWRERSLGWS